MGASPGLLLPHPLSEASSPSPRLDPSFLKPPRWRRTGSAFCMSSTLLGVSFRGPGYQGSVPQECDGLQPVVHYCKQVPGADSFTKTRGLFSSQLWKSKGLAPAPARLVDGRNLCERGSARHQAGSRRGVRGQALAFLTAHSRESCLGEPLKLQQPLR